jgi:hypothetical protein
VEHQQRPADLAELRDPRDLVTDRAQLGRAPGKDARDLARVERVGQ